MDQSENPYASPLEQGSRTPNARAVRHVRAVAILLIVQGALECLMGLLLIALAIIVFAMPVGPANAQGQNAGMAIAMGYYLIFGLGAAITGGVRIYAGIRNLSFHSHTLGIVGLALGLVTLMTCYCAPTSIALAIYGLIIYLNQDVAQAFAMGERGDTPDQIIAYFSMPR